ncbi:hypothetical protein [Crocosphaera sp.]|uniref:hypothetical protein n=1 Tax=Crocosphaera sp. TaxID=2729996 RepID=UPI0026388CEB|nr:hypothetical protein [Crocosphaera sp.]MDJ0579190.1 hypothetical protein [Crocosphaera sp.]
MEENLSRYQTQTAKEQLLDGLHKKLRNMTSEAHPNGRDIRLIQQNIRELLPSVDTGKALPYKKTPNGRIQVLQMTYTRNQTDELIETEIAHLKFFARTVAELGLQLEILTNEKSRGDIEKELVKDEYQLLNYTIIESQKPVWKWAEDGVEYLENGRTAILYPFDEQLLQWAMTESRRHRWTGKIDPENLEEALRDDLLWIPLGISVNTVKVGLERECATQVKGQNICHLRAYIEGGNMITGEDKTGQPVIIVGKDAIGATAHIYQLNDDDVRRIICEDFGLEGIQQVICVEQPGQFHLDMGMLFIGNGVVIVNDSRESLKDAMEMAEIAPCLTTEKMAAKLKLQCQLEKEATKDLETAGLEVRRDKLENNLLYNFFNGEFVEGKDGFNYYITNGGPQEQEEKFQTLMVEEWKVVKKVIFSPKDAAHKSLQERGGVGCRIKGHRIN